MRSIYHLMVDIKNMINKKKILKKKIKENDGKGWMIWPYNPYQQPMVPGSYLLATSPNVPWGVSKK